MMFQMPAFQTHLYGDDIRCTAYVSTFGSVKENTLLHILTFSLCVCLTWTVWLGNCLNSESFTLTESKNCFCFCFFLIYRLLSLYQNHPSPSSLGSATMTLKSIILFQLL